MLKKYFFRVIDFMFGLLIVFFTSSLFLNSSSPLVFEINQNFAIIKNDSRAAVDVSNMEEFLNAANKNQDINLVANIDFSDATVSDYLINSYSGTIQGNNFTLYNGLKELNPDPIHMFYSLFDSFTGKVYNLTFDNFPFFAQTISHATLSSTSDLQNITIRNTYVDGFNIENTYSGAKLHEISTGIFAEVILTSNLDQFSIVNSGFTNNNINLYFDNQGNSAGRLATYFGSISGRFSNSKINNTYLIDNSLSNNKFHNYKDKNQNDTANGVFEFGVLSSRAYNSEIENVFVRNTEIANNSIISTSLNFGVLNGYNDGSKVSESYIFKNDIKDNKFAITDDFNFGMFQGWAKNGGQAPVYVRNVSISYGVENNLYAKTIGGSEILATPEEYGVNVESFLSKSNNNYFVGSGSSSKINYIDAKDVNTNFWENTIGYSKDAWNLKVLLDENLQIVDGSTQTGFPIFQRTNYLITSIDTSGDTFKINVDNIASSDTISIKIKSIFGDEQDLVLNDSNAFDTQISKHYFDDKNQDFIMNFLNTNFWIELNTNANFDNLILLGNFTNRLPISFENPEIAINNEITATATPLSTLTFTQDIICESLIMSDLSDYETFDVTSNYGTDQININDANTMQVPDYVDNYNNYYQIHLSQTFKYIDQAKTMQTKDVVVNGAITNIDNAPQNLLVPQLKINTSYDEAVKELTINLFVENSDTYLETSEDLQNTTFKINSVFQEFSGNSEVTYTLNDFTKINYNTFSKVISFSSDVTREKLNSFYSIEFVSSLEYYQDLSGTKAPIDSFTLEGDLTNQDSSIIEPYDPSKVFDGIIETSLVDNNKIMIEFINTFPYLLDYQINLVLKTNSQTDHISFTTSSSKQVLVNVDSKLIKYYNSLTLEEQNVFNINDYYSLNFDPDSPSTITFVDSLGMMKTSSVDTWISANREYNQLTIKGLITNTTNVILPIPEVEDPINDNTLIIFITGFFLALILAILLYFILTFRAKPKDEIVIT